MWDFSLAECSHWGCCLSPSALCCTTGFVVLSSRLSCFGLVRPYRVSCIPEQVPTECGAFLRLVKTVKTEDRHGRLCSGERVALLFSDACLYIPALA